MKFRIIVLLLCAVCFAVSCRRTDPVRFTIKVPGMINRECANIVHAAVNKVPGIIKDDENPVHINLNERTVEVTYESLVTAKKNLEFAIAKAGFAANDVPADKAAAAALPESCKVPSFGPVPGPAAGK